MIGKILKATQGKPCSCPIGKTCTKCQTKKAERANPRIFIEDSKTLPVPVKITTYKGKTDKSFLRPHRKNTPYQEPLITARYQKKKSWSNFRKPARTKSANRETSISRWYKRRRALSDLKKITRLEQLESARQKKAQREREEEFLKQWNAREKVSVVPVEVCPLYPGRESFTCKTKKQKAKERKNFKATEAKLCCRSEIVCSYAKKHIG